MSNSEKKENFDGNQPDSPTELLKKELPPEAAPLMEELPSKEASPFLSALSPKPAKKAARSSKTYAMPQRRTVFFGESEIAAIEEEIQAVSSPKPPSIPSQRISAVAKANALPTPTPETLNAQTPPPQPPAASPLDTNPGVLGTPSESLLSTEDLGEVADPSETLSALLDEVFSEGVPDFELLFRSQNTSVPPAVQSASPSPPSNISAAPTALIPPPPEKMPEPPLPEAPPWDPIATLAAKAQTPSLEDMPLPTSLPGEPAELDFSSITRTELVEETEEPTLTSALSLEETEKRFSNLGPLELNPDEIASELQKTLEKASPLPEIAAPSGLQTLLQQEATPPQENLAEPIFQLSSPPSFVDPETAPEAPAAPSFHPLENTHEAAPPSLARLLGAFATDALLLCFASLSILWAANSLTAPTPTASSWLSSAAAWQILGPTGVALLALLAAAYAIFFATAWNGASPGRKLFGLRLVNKHGLSIGFLRASFRALFALFSFALALSGFWWALIDKRRQTFHDKCTGSFVIRIQPK